MKKILIIIDVQNDFVSGTLRNEMAIDIIPNIKKKIAEHDNASSQIIFTRDSHTENYYTTQEGRNLPIKHCVLDTNGWNIYDEIDKDVMTPIYLDKTTFGFNNWGYVLNNLINDETVIEIIGLVTNICVISNAIILKSSFPETEIIVDASCCAGTSVEAHNQAIEVMKSCQINIINQ